MLRSEMMRKYASSKKRGIDTSRSAPLPANTAVRAIFLSIFLYVAPALADDRLHETDDVIKVSLPDLEATVRKQGYVTGVAAQTFSDKKTGFRDAGYGLDIVDWIMEPGSDAAYRDQLDKELVYEFN